VPAALDGKNRHAFALQKLSRQISMVIIPDPEKKISSVVDEDPPASRCISAIEQSGHSTKPFSETGSARLYVWTHHHEMPTRIQKIYAIISVLRRLFG